MKKSVTILVRCEPALTRRVDALAKKRGVSRSDFVRAAVRAEVAREEAEAAMTAYDRLRPWIGRSGNAAAFPARDAGRQFADYLEEKDRERRAR